MEVNTYMFQTPRNLNRDIIGTEGLTVPLLVKAAFWSSVELYLNNQPTRCGIDPSTYNKETDAFVYVVPSLSGKSYLRNVFIPGSETALFDPTPSLDQQLLSWTRLRTVPFSSHLSLSGRMHDRAYYTSIVFELRERPHSDQHASIYHQINPPQPVMSYYRYCFRCGSLKALFDSRSLPVAAVSHLGRQNHGALIHLLPHGGHLDP